MASNVTPQVSGKVKAGSVASTVASFVVSALLTYAGSHVPEFESLFDNPWVVAVCVSALTGGLTFVTGYVARHLPAELVQDVKEAWTAEANSENLAEDETE